MIPGAPRHPAAQQSQIPHSFSLRRLTTPGRIRSRKRPTRGVRYRVPYAQCRFPLEMVICRRSPTARDLTLKKSAFGLMTDPANPGLQAEEGELLFNYYRALARRRGKSIRLVPGIHVLWPRRTKNSWMAGTSPAMTCGGCGESDRNFRPRRATTSSGRRGRCRSGCRWASATSRS